MSQESLPLCGKPCVEMIAVMARYNPFAEHAGMRRILESEVNPEILAAVEKLGELGFINYLLAVPDYNFEKLEGQVNRVKEILSCFSYPYNRRIAGAPGNFKRQDYVEWMLQASKMDLARGLCRLAQLNQPKIYLFWSHEEATGV